MGEVYDGVISGVTEWGLFVELNDNKCEGLVPVRDLADDYYDFDEKNYCLVGRRRGVKYRLGDNVKVKVARANLERKQLDFALIDENARQSKEDDMGLSLSVAEALRSGKKHVNRSEKRKTRSRGRR